MGGQYAKIVDFDKFEDIRSTTGKIVCTSGGLDPIHPGHATCIVDSKQYGDTLVVVVNGDAFLRAKKGRPFMDLRTRCLLVSCIRNVDYVVPFEIENDPTVCVACEGFARMYSRRVGTAPTTPIFLNGRSVANFRLS